MFRFLESREDGNKGGTTFVQAEDFEGWLSFIFVSWWPEWLGGMRGSIQGDFVRFNGGFKGWCEEGRNRG
jgi:hypothetical protein